VDIGLILTPTRILLLIAFIPAVITVLKTRDLRLQTFDWFVLSMALWLFLGILVNNGSDRAFKFGGSLALEMLGGYLIARAYVRTPAQFSGAVRFYVMLVAILGVIAAPEALFKYKLLPYFQVSNLEGAEGMRLGMHRAAATLDHPILYGVFCTTSLGLAWYTFRKLARWFALCAISLSALFAVSSAALLACALTLAFIVWERLTRLLPYRGVITLCGIALLLLFLQSLAQGSIIGVILRLVTLDPWTAYYRQIIWEYVTANVEASPLFGIGLNDWARPSWMTSSVDSFWLVVSLFGGIPPIIFIVAAIALLILRINAKCVVQDALRRPMRVGWTAAILVLCVQAFTVHYWGSMHSFFFFVVGLGAWMTDSKGGPTRRVFPRKDAVYVMPARALAGRRLL
jgi:uncharacterized protein with PQ loop repeat